MEDSPVVVITGCTSGIGLHMTGVFASKGYRVVATARNLDRLRKYADDRGWPSSRVLLSKLEVKSVEDWREAFDLAVGTWGRVDYLINNAGYGAPGYIHETPLEEISKHINTNTIGSITGAKLAAELMVKQGSGHIINIGSLAGVAPVAGISLYSASKFALRGFSLATALELRDHGVHVSVVSMDVVDTPMLDPQYEMKESAVSFSGKRILRIEEVEAAILKCMQKKRVEVLIPAGRGWMSKLANILPSLAQPIYRSMVKKGRKRQAEKVEQRKAAGLMD